MQSSAKKSNKSPSSSFFVSNLNQAANKQESDRIASWEKRVFFERERPTPTNCMFFLLHYFYLFILKPSL